MLAGMADETDTTTFPPAPTVSPLAAAAAAEPPKRAVLVPVWAVGALGGFAAGAAVVGLLWALSTGGSSSGSGGTFDLTGSMTLTSSSVTVSSGCGGVSGYDDIRQGAAVTVYDESGKVLATGALGAGTPKGLHGCDFTVTVRDVPKGSKFYQVEVSHRGKINLSSSAAEAGLFGATLG